MGAAPLGHAAREEAPLSREAVVAQVLRTPEGGVCVVSAPPGYGRRTLVTLATGSSGVQQFDAAGHNGTPTGEALRAMLHRLDEAGGGWLHIANVRPGGGDLAPTLPGLFADCPPTCRIVLTTEHELGSLLAEVRLAGRLVEIEQADLRLSTAEAHELLIRSAPGLSFDDAPALVALSDGWASALLLAARRRASHPAQDVVAWLRSRGAELLLGPWLDTLDAGAVDMLVSTAFLDVLHPDLVDAVLPGTGAGSTLLRLAHHPGPVRPAPTPTHQGRLGYLRHPLLTERLRAVALAKPAAPVLYARAATWLRAHGDLAGELENLLAAGLHRQAADRLYEAEDKLLSGGRAGVALRWYESLADAPGPGAAPHRELVSLLRRAWAQTLSGDTVAARSSLGHLQSALAERSPAALSSGPGYASFEGEVQVLTCWLAHQDGDLLTMVAAAAQAVHLFDGDLSRNSHQLASLYLARGLTLLGRLQEADTALDTVRSRTFALSAVSEGTRAEVEAELAWEQGQVHECRSWAARRHRWSSTVEAGALTGHRPPVAQWLAEAEVGRTHEAASGIRALLATETAPLRVVTDEVVALVGLCDVYRAAGQLRLALAATADARQLVQEHSPNGGLLGRVARAEARVRLCAGDAVRAERLLAPLPAVPDVLLLRIRLGLLRGAPVARQMVREMEPTTPKEEVELVILSAWAQVDHSRARAEQDLLRAAELAVAHGMSTPLVGVPTSLLRLARATAEHFVDDALLRLVEVAEAASPEPRVAHDGAGVPPGGAALSRGELQLVPLLPTRMSNADIAEHLGVSVNTVKTRLRRLFAKLGVNDRRGAALRVSELGLLGTDPTHHSG